MRRPVITPEIIAFGVSVLLIIVILYYILPSAWMDATFVSRLSIGNFKLDWWHISHIWFYMVLGAACPGNFWFYTSMGAGFEVFEQLLGNAQAKAGDKRRKKQGEDYWFGRWEDVVVNGIGYIIGEWSATGALKLTP
jgi:hypothetical protein